MWSSTRNFYMVCGYNFNYELFRVYVFLVLLLIFIQLTTGEAKNNITVHVVADIPEISDTIPATIAPKMPPTSNRIERSADKVGPKVLDDCIYKGSQ